MARDSPEARTRAWIEALVIGMNLCPFAARPYRKGLVRFVTTQATREAALDEVVVDELWHLRDKPAQEVATTIIILARARPNFLSYLDYAARVEALISATKLDGVIQLATFHPRYRFDKTAASDIANATNRSPYPLLHLLREDDIEHARATYKDIDAVPSRNALALRALGRRKLAALLGG